MKHCPRYLGPIRSDADYDPDYLKAGIIIPRRLTDDEMAALKRKPKTKTPINLV
jgi:hypothetical protein